MSSAIQYSQVSKGVAMLGLGVAAVGAGMSIDAYLSDAQAGPRKAQKYDNRHQASGQADWIGALFGQSVGYQAPAVRTVVGRGAVHDSNTRAVHLTSRYVKLDRNTVYDTRRHIVIEFDDKSVVTNGRGKYWNRSADTTATNLNLQFQHHLDRRQAGDVAWRLFQQRRGKNCPSVLGYYRMAGPSPFSGGDSNSSSSSSSGSAGGSGSSGTN